MYVRIASFVKNFYSMNTQTQPKIQFYFPTHLFHIFFFSSSLFFSSVVFTQHTYSHIHRERVKAGKQYTTLEDDSERKNSRSFSNTIYPCRLHLCVCIFFLKKCRIFILIVASVCVLSLLTICSFGLSKHFGVREAKKKIEIGKRRKYFSIELRRC